MAVQSLSKTGIVNSEKFRNMASIPPALNVSYLVIAGGGGGGGAILCGGGGAGGYRTNVLGQTSGGGFLAEFPSILQTGVNFTVTVGGGGTGDSGENSGVGANSRFASIVSFGGGAGATNTQFAIEDKQCGGSGAGSRYGGGRTAGRGVPNQGNNGRTGLSSGGVYNAGGGGGAGAAGSFASPTGGNGQSSNITGTQIIRAGGGGGGGHNNNTFGAGGTGGGGSGASGGGAGAGTANTGGGGGGSRNATGGNGGSGIVILKYPSFYTITVGAGLSGSTQTTGSDKVTTITAGTGNVSWERA